MSTPRLREEALSFDCQGERLVGVISLPDDPCDADTAFVIVVGGPQVRTGSHRQFTQLCRAVAAAGLPALRFDLRGMGDSSGALRGFECIDDDIAAALAALRKRLPSVNRIVLFGLCDGASAALMHLQAKSNSQVVGLVLLNPWVRSAQTLARAHVKHYYWQRLRQPEFWSKLLRGDVAAAAVRDLLANLRLARTGARKDAPIHAPAASFQERMLQGAEGFQGPVLWVLSGNDYTAKEFIELVAQSPRWEAVQRRPGAQRLDLPEADHTVSDRHAADALTRATVAWLRTLQGGSST